jgi:ethanolamine utilization protein EutN
VQLARVTGTVVASVKADGLEGVKFLLVQPLDRHQQPQGSPVIAADAVHTAGPGELVYIVSAREAAQALPNTFVPVDHAIVGIVDAVEEIRVAPRAEERR